MDLYIGDMIYPRVGRKQMLDLNFIMKKIPVNYDFSEF